MSDLLSIGSSALLAYRRALDTTSHNIANVNTAGYTRQRVELTTRAPTGSGSGYFGTGVDVSTVRRISDGLTNTRLQSDTSAYARLEVYAGFAGRIDTLLSSADTSLAAPLQNFFDAANALAQNPTSTAARQALIGNAQTLAARFNQAQSQLDGMSTEVDARMRTTVDEINQLSRSLAQINERIAQAQGQFSGQPPNDLLDQRDQLLQDLAGRIGITTVSQDDGSLNVFTASGQALVLGSQATALSVRGDAYQSGRLDIVFGANTVVTGQLSGGTLGGLLDVRREVLDPARSELGRLAVGIAAAVNDQHAQGLDATGALGGAFFAEPAGTALAATANGGGAQVAVGIGDVALLNGHDYELRYQSGGWQLTDRSTGASVAMSGSGTAADPLRGAGIELTISGTAAEGDRWWLQPTANAAGAMRVAIQDPARIAAAAPLRASTGLGNSGSATAATPAVVDASNPALLDPVTIQFTSATTYQVNGSGSYSYSYSYSPGTPITVNGWQLALNGTPAAGDSFGVQRGATDSGDNGNARALAGLATRGVLDGGRSSLGSTQTALASSAGLNAQQATLQRDAQAAMQTQSRNARDSVSGVNLDEEAADLVRFQQAYQAAARVIQVADTLFQTLLQATGR
ncbi:MAG TPA: flagellar hook-associated protein FlgK [Solimonas sp.]